ncbi:MAG: NUDIX domain-containing protein [Candidatus Aenigmatarchaeota archaeon]
MKFYPGLKAIIEKEGKFLILKRSEKDEFRANEWDIPGGGMKFGEEPKECLKREVKEESGLDIDNIKPLSFWTFFKDSGRTQVFVVNVLCKHKSGKVILSNEHSEFKWIDSDEVGKFNIYEGAEKDFESAKQELKF